MKTANKNRRRLIVKDGLKNFVLPVGDIAMLYISGRNVFVVDHESEKYTFNKSLTEIEQQLDCNIFFRANRRTIVNINFIKAFTICKCNKLKVEMNVYVPDAEIIVSQETAPLFKTWICES